MAWSGWASLGGTELVNASRTEQYARNLGIRWLTGAYDNEALPLILGHGAYTTPLQDDAPWIDPDNPHSWEFLGAYPVDITGIEDSTRTAEVIEYIDDGGVAGRIRHATKAVVFNLLLVATTEAGADYGMTWINQATLGGPCEGVDPFGVDLCYLSSEPLVDTAAGGDYTSCLPPLLRHLRRTSVVGPPRVMVKHNVSEGALWAVQFAAVAGVPWQFGPEAEIIRGFLGPEPYQGVVTSVDEIGYIAPDDDCVEPLYAPLYDPLCPALVAPPAPPDVPMGCLDLPSSWLRRSFTIPETEIATWSDRVPVITFSAGETGLRTLRMRFYATPDVPGGPSVDPCGWCGDIVVSYIPPNSSLIFDAASETVDVIQPGGVRRRADTLVIGSDGRPFDWPALSCGFSYLATFDQPITQAPPVIDLSLVPRMR